ncbi:MAG: FKBP-type peptidyl-prolyl cis-trans isomerase [Sterolibacteriaceae bacterium]|uniref:Peptidyl-prolyl cis-trans isomerase n=1 Tax=Candidatus Methylophosphatis roskildensis TaxID=2899263 RepID=A0A9D7E5T1_9PROT|nr:FKBP-type peptidyl-prolyl cis-trans isomerase [Candidatus Methylophosphatis roskildensis]MBK7237082.1 FKBP-type peptidyl-prolyl cis-trans isomerase [Sterolibacteriaceae bacterium]
MTQTVQADSLVTLHYRMALADDEDLITTFGGSPATLKLGNGELAPTLEHCLAGLPVGQRRVFVLEAEQAFGAHNPQLLERVPLTAFPADAPPEEMSMIEFTGPDGAKYAGLVRQVRDGAATVDFNHPLAGKAIRFEVEIVGIV